jgi:hypothetical protein
VAGAEVCVVSNRGGCRRAPRIARLGAGVYLLLVVGQGALVQAASRREGQVFHAKGARWRSPVAAAVAVEAQPYLQEC